MTVIPQRQLRNEIGDVLRRAEAGESFTVTVNGRPVAQLVPLGRRRRYGTAQQFMDIVARTPVDGGWAMELAEERCWERENNPDPWAARPREALSGPDDSSRGNRDVEAAQ